MRPFLVLVLAAVACTPAPAPVPPEPDVFVVDASPRPLPAGPDGGDEFTIACANLARLGCSDAASGVVVCAGVMRLASSGPQPLTKFNTSCLAGATSKAAARACGGVDCL